MCLRSTVDRLTDVQKHSLSLPTDSGPESQGVVTTSDALPVIGRFSLNLRHKSALLER